jgi:hypothetical protein
MDMADWLKLTLYVIVVEMVISWLVAARYLYVVGAELRRSRKREAGYIPPTYRGPPDGRERDHAPLKSSRRRWRRKRAHTRPTAMITAAPKSGGALLPKWWNA